MRRFRFAVGGPVLLDGAGLRAAAKRAEELGYSAWVVPDHFGAQVAPIAAMMAIADATTTLRVGTFVANNDMRHPAVLAKEAATVDVMSGGRVELGIGAGWRDDEYARLGMPFDPPTVRIARLGESVELIRALFGEGPTTFQGHFYQVRDLDVQPKPLQRPAPPIAIGGGGRRVLSLAARVADIVGLAPRLRSARRWDPRTITAAATEEKVATVRHAAGTRFDDVELNVYPVFGPVQVTTKRRPAVRAVADLIAGRFGSNTLTEDEILDSPHVFIGTHAQLAEKVLGLRERFGITYVRVGLAEAEAFAPVVERLAGR